MDIIGATNICQELYIKIQPQNSKKVAIAVKENLSSWGTGSPLILRRKEIPDLRFLNSLNRNILFNPTGGVAAYKLSL